MKRKLWLCAVCALNAALFGAEGGAPSGQRPPALQTIRLPATSLAGAAAVPGVVSSGKFGKGPPEQLVGLGKALRVVPTSKDLSLGISDALRESATKQFGDLLRRLERVYRVYDSPEIAGIDNPELAARKLGVVIPPWADSEQQLRRAWLQSRTRPMLQVFPDRLVDFDVMVAVESDSAGRPLPRLKETVRELDAPLRSMTGSVFRIEREDPEVTVIGSATFVGDGCLLTVEHVAHQIRLAKSTGMRVFANATTAPGAPRFEITGVVHPLITVEKPSLDGDFAIVQVADDAGRMDPSAFSPSPAVNGSGAFKHQMVVSLGHPVPSRYFGDPDAPFASHFELLFGGKPGNLRVSPGLWLRDRLPANVHDAACFQGNSGGPVIELPSLRWIGMHVGPGKFGVGGNVFIRFDQLNNDDALALNALLSRAGKSPLEPTL